MLCRGLFLSRVVGGIRHQQPFILRTDSVPHSQTSHYQPPEIAQGRRARAQQDVTDKQKGA